MELRDFDRYITRGLTAERKSQMDLLTRLCACQMTLHRPANQQRTHAPLRLQGRWNNMTMCWLVRHIYIYIYIYICWAIVAVMVWNYTLASGVGCSSSWVRMGAYIKWLIYIIVYKNGWTRICDGVCPSRAQTADLLPGFSNVLHVASWCINKLENRWPSGYFQA